MLARGPPSMEKKHGRKDVLQEQMGGFSFLFLRFLLIIISIQRFFFFLAYETHTRQGREGKGGFFVLHDWDFVVLFHDLPLYI